MKISKFVLVALTCFFVLPAWAQGPLSVHVITEKGSESISNMVAAKIGGATRYSLGESNHTPGVGIDVNCVGTSPSLGWACTFEVDYYSWWGDPSTLDVHDDTIRADSVLLCPPDGEYCAEQIFEQFVKDTQPDNLSQFDAHNKAEWNDAYSAGEVKGIVEGGQSAYKSCQNEIATLKSKMNAQSKANAKPKGKSHE